jgi:HD-GYP domain-containing protein (c-di-GMP phosphodiesterase class II)
LPFGLRNAAGQLLLGPGLRIENLDRLAELKLQALFADEVESADWNRRLAAAMDQMIRQGAQLRDVVAARPEARGRESAVVETSLAEQWQDLVVHLNAALREVSADSDWRARVMAVHSRARQCYQRKPDASLYLLTYQAGQPEWHAKYSCHHALLTLLICEEAAARLTWPQAWIDSLGRAALTMNLAMLRLQNQLAQTHLALTAEMRAEIDAHAEASAQQLEQAGLADRLCLQVVRLHHDATHAEVALADLPPERQLARLLRRVDIFCAKLSSRASRPAMSPVQAARQACLGVGGVPDDIGGALLKAVGLYPPGSFVALANGELGIVIKRGRRANLPYVATLVTSSGSALAEPVIRDTLDRRYAVKAAVPSAAVKVRPPHERLLALG